MPKIKNVLALLIAAVLVFGWTNIVSAQTSDQAALIAQLQKQVQQLLTQIQTLQKEVTELKSETGIQTSTSSPFSPLTPVSDEEESDLPEFTRSLSLGTRGDDVRKLQEFLARDKDIYPEGLATGFYGPKTVEAVKRWQKKNNLDAIGIVGPKTIAKFRELGQGVVKGLMEQGTPSGMVPPGLMTAPGIQRQMIPSTVATSSPQANSGQATTTPIITMPPMTAATTSTSSGQATTTPAVPAEPATAATPAQPTQTSAIPATPATPAQPASSSTTASNELKVTYPNGGETWYKGNSYTITWQNPLAGGFTGQEKYYWNVLLKRGNTAWQADGGVPVTQSSYTWSKWTDWAEPIPNAEDFKVGISLVDTCAAQVGGSCPSANISITPAGGIDYSDGYFTATSTPPSTATTPTDITSPTLTLAVGYPNLTTQTQPIYVGFNANEEVKVIYEYGPTTSYGSTLNVWDSYRTTNGIYLPTLSSGTTYHIRAKATDRAGNIGYSQDYAFTTASPSTPPAITSGPTNTPTGAEPKEAIMIGFGTSLACLGTIQYGTTPTYPFSNTKADDLGSQTSHYFYLTGLSPNTTYYYQVNCVADSGSVATSGSYTTGGSTTITAPANASVVTGYVSGQIVNLQWADNSSNETSFDIYRRSSGLNVTPGSWTKISQAGSNVTTSTDSPGAGTWEYRVDACNSAGCASNSGTVQLTVSSSGGTTASTTPSASVYDQMRDQLRSMEIILRGLLGR